MATHEFYKVRSKVFNFHSVRSVTTSKLKTRSSHRTETCKYQIDTGSDGNLMPIKKYKMLFLNTNVNA